MLPSFESPLPPMIASTASGSSHGADLGQVAPVAFCVHAVAEDEAVLDTQADEVGADRLGLAQGLLDQHCAVEARRAKLHHALANRRHPVAAVEDVVKPQPPRTARAGRRRYAPADIRAARPRAVARGMDVVEVE